MAKVTLPKVSIIEPLPAESSFFMSTEIKNLIKTVKRVSLNPSNSQKTKDLAKEAIKHLYKLLKEEHE